MKNDFNGIDTSKSETEVKGLFNFAGSNVPQMRGDFNFYFRLTPRNAVRY